MAFSFSLVSDSSAPPLGISCKLASHSGIIEENFAVKRKILHDTTAVERRKLPYKLLGGLQRDGKKFMTNKKSQVMTCCARAIPKTFSGRGGIEYKSGCPGHIEIHQTALNARFKYLTHCASPMICPVCGAYLRFKQADIIQQVADFLIREKNFSFLFVTFTARHNATTTAKDSIKVFQKAQRFMRAGRDFQEFKKMYGLRFEQYTNEITFDHPDSKKKTGVHWHRHSIMYFDHQVSFEEYCGINSFFQRRWIHSLEKVGLSGDKGVCCRVDFPYVYNMKEKCKESVIIATQLKKLSHYVTKNVAFELTGDQMKVGRGARRINQWQLLKICIDRKDDVKCWAMFDDYMQAVKGVAFAYNSRGLLEFCGVKKIDDKAVLEQPESELLLFSFEKRYSDFRRIVRNSYHAEVLVASDKAETLEEAQKNIEEVLIELKLKDVVKRE